MPRKKEEANTNKSDQGHIFSQLMREQYELEESEEQTAAETSGDGQELPIDEEQF